MPDDRQDFQKLTVTDDGVFMLDGVPLSTLIHDHVGAIFTVITKRNRLDYRLIIVRQNATYFPRHEGRETLVITKIDDHLSTLYFTRDLFLDILGPELQVRFNDEEAQLRLNSLKHDLESLQKKIGKLNQMIDFREKIKASLDS